MKLTLLAATAALFVVAGCATSTTETTVTTEQPATYERVYRPGSNIMQKEKVVLTKEEKEKQADDARAMLQNSPRPGVQR